MISNAIEQKFLYIKNEVLPDLSQDSVRIQKRSALANSPGADVIRTTKKVFLDKVNQKIKIKFCLRIQCMHYKCTSSIIAMIMMLADGV